MATRTQQLPQRRLPEPRTPTRAPAPSGAATHAQWRWLAAGLALAFAVPFAFADLLDVERDAYYAIYGAIVLAFVALWVRATDQDVRGLLERRWRSATVLGFLFAGALAFVVTRDAATSHPHGWTFVGAILWRGVFYGGIDGLILSVFPILAVFGAFSSRPLRRRTKRAVAGIGALALAATFAFTAVYHLGYPDFRGDKLRKPLAGDLLWSIPTLVTLNPVGAIAAHIGLHVAAVTHSYHTTTFLPPHR